ncbi:hypothetical protein UlMin_004105 [Ulmus minor]
MEWLISSRLCATDLEGWNMESFSRLKIQVRKAKAAFDRIDKNLSSHNWKEHQRLEKTLDALRYKEERYWRQKSKDLWLKCGDRNSKFFHQKASAHSSERKVTHQLNEQLEQACVTEDVKTAVFQMAPTKSPGADGMSAIFYQKFWHIVGDEITAAYNAIIGFECLHAIKQRKTKKNYLALKLDMAKRLSLLLAQLSKRFLSAMKLHLGNWKSKLLSVGGREVLSKSVIQAILSYSMNLFKLPSTLIRELHRLCAQFWWGGEPGKRRMHWCTWEKLCSHKADGGMGFRDLRLFNKAILAKQAWRIHSHPTSLAARVLQGFYFHKSSFLQVKANSSSSFIWRSILWGRELYKQGLTCKIGSGQNTYIYHDCWLPRAGIFKISSPRVLGNFDKVISLITASGSWDSSLIRESFHKDEANAILSLPLPRRTTPDTLLWHYDKSGHYTVRSGYWLANKCRSVPSSSTSSLNSWWKQFWRLRVPSKIRVFIWKAFHNWIPSSINLANHGVSSQKRCLICNKADDTTLHALWGCKALDSLKSCYSWARLHQADFLEANCRKGDPSKKVVASPWQAPEVGFVKVNSNATWCSKQKKFGLGSVIRDYTGKVLGSVATPISSSVSVAVAESWALEKDASLAKQIEFSAVILESDCLGVTKPYMILTSVMFLIAFMRSVMGLICISFHTLPA